MFLLGTVAIISFRLVDRVLLLILDRADRVAALLEFVQQLFTALRTFARECLFGEVPSLVFMTLESESRAILRDT